MVAVQPTEANPGRNIGEFIGRLREKRGITGRALAAKTVAVDPDSKGVSHWQIRKLEGGRVRNPGVRTLWLIARALGFEDHVEMVATNPQLHQSLGGRWLLDRIARDPDRVNRERAELWGVPVGREDTSSHASSDTAPASAVSALAQPDALEARMQTVVLREVHRLFERFTDQLKAELNGAG